jgi:ubiquinone/menaquinone biosynthesis C-methylase UbiE
VWKELENTFHRGDRVLEIGCGTGVDACFLAERGVRVVACDSSSAMMRVAGRRVAGRPGDSSETAVRLRLLPAENLADVGGRAPFGRAPQLVGARICPGRRM